ncbi:MAG: ankyrin repeat domain-containing protein [Candidatus Babeliales bacterium]|nr:ankyrin repeat domain-containing protein [Candidatus Babeliales bacterium]
MKKYLVLLCIVVINLFAILQPSDAGVSLEIQQEYVQLNDNFDEYGYKPIHYMAQNSDLDAIEELLKKETTKKHKKRLINSCTTQGVTPLHLICAFGQSSGVRFLLNRGAHIDAQDEWYQSTPLHYAVYNNNIGVFKALLASDKLNINVQNMVGDTALHLAVKTGNTAIVFHLKNDARTATETPDFNGKTALNWAYYYQSLGYDMSMIINILNNPIQRMPMIRLNMNYKPTEKNYFPNADTDFKARLTELAKEETSCSSSDVLSSCATSVCATSSVSVSEQETEQNQDENLIEKVESEQEWLTPKRVARMRNQISESGGDSVAVSVPENNNIACDDNEDEEEIQSQSEEAQIAAAKVGKKKAKKKNKSTGNTDLHAALISKNDNIDALITFENVNTHNKAGDYPLHIAVKQNSAYCRAILELCPNIVNEPGLQGLRALDLAQTPEMLNLVLEFNPRFNIINKETQKRIVIIAEQEENNKYKAIIKLRDVLRKKLADSIGLFIKTKDDKYSVDVKALLEIGVKAVIKVGDKLLFVDKK